MYLALVVKSCDQLDVVTKSLLLYFRMLSELEVIYRAGSPEVLRNSFEEIKKKKKKKLVHLGDLAVGICIELIVPLKL